MDRQAEEYMGIDEWMDRHGDGDGWMGDWMVEQIYRNV